MVLVHFYMIWVSGILWVSGVILFFLDYSFGNFSLNRILNFIKYFSFIVPKNFRFKTLILGSIIVRGFYLIITSNYNIPYTYIFFLIILILILKFLTSKSILSAIYSYIFSITVLFIFWYLVSIIYADASLQVDSFLYLFLMNYWHNMDFEINTMIDNISNSLFNPNGPKPPKFDPMILGVNNDPDWDQDILDSINNTNRPLEEYISQQLDFTKNVKFEDTNTLVLGEKYYNISELSKKTQEHNSKLLTLGMDSKYTAVAKNIFYMNNKEDLLAVEGNHEFNFIGRFHANQLNVVEFKKDLGDIYSLLITEINLLHKAYLYYTDHEIFSEYKYLYECWQKRQLNNTSGRLSEIYNNGVIDMWHYNYTDFNVYHEELCENFLFVSLWLEEISILFKHLSENRNRIDDSNFLNIYTEEILPILKEWRTNSNSKVAIDKYSEVNIDNCRRWTIDFAVKCLTDTWKPWLNQESITLMDEYKQNPLKWTENKKAEITLSKIQTTPNTTQLGLNTAHSFAYKPINVRNFFGMKS